MFANHKWRMDVTYTMHTQTTSEYVQLDPLTSNACLTTYIA